MSELENQKDLIEEKDWDFLIILDACRYDYFKNNYQDFLSGRLEKVRTSGSLTGEWLSKTFDDYFGGTTYISSNPSINSKGFALSDMFSYSSFDSSWKAVKHFSRIVDLWDDGWDYELGTVPPEEVNKRTTIVSDLNPNENLIVHYMQPHRPFIVNYPDPENEREANVIANMKKVQDQRTGGALEGTKKSKSKLERLRLFFGRKIRKYFGSWFYSKIAKLFGFKDMNILKQEYGNEVISRIHKELYEGNLREVLRHVSNMKDELSGNVVITSDHGDFLGEDGEYGHSEGSDNPILREVPWLEVKS